MIALGTAETSGIVNYLVSYDLLENNNDWELPIGKSSPGRHCFLLDNDSQQQITAPGVVGELCVMAGEPKNDLITVLNFHNCFQRRKDQYPERVLRP